MNAVIQSNSCEKASKPVDLVVFLDNMRLRCGLAPKGRYESNFIFASPVMESIHIIRNELSDVLEELERKGVR